MHTHNNTIGLMHFNAIQNSMMIWCHLNCICRFFCHLFFVFVFQAFKFKSNNLCQMWWTQINDIFKLFWFISLEHNSCCGVVKSRVFFLSHPLWNVFRLNRINYKTTINCRKNKHAQILFRIDADFIYFLFFRIDRTQISIDAIFQQQHRSSSNSFGFSKTISKT